LQWETDVRVQQVLVSLALCMPCIIPAAIVYVRHRRRTPEGERFPLWLYVLALLACAWFALWFGFEQGAWFAFKRPAGSPGWLFGMLLAGPLMALIAVSVAAWLMTFSPRDMKRVVPVALVLGLPLGAYHYRYEFFREWMALSSDGLLRYRLQSTDVEDLQRFAPMMEAQMRNLPILKDVCLDPELKKEQGVVSTEPKLVVGEVPTRAITFRLVPPSKLADATRAIDGARVQLAIPNTFGRSFAKAESDCH
jgi:hypothetical protein